MAGSELANDPDRMFNQEQELWGDNDRDLTAKPIVRRSFISGYISPREAPSPTSGRIQRQLGATPADVKPVTAQVAQEPEEPREIFTGSNAMVRAARIVHQYDVNFWDQNGVVDYAAKSGQPAPEVSDTRYEDLKAFSYLPDALLPSKELFDDLMNPTVRAPLLVSMMRTAGLNTSVGPAAASPDRDTEEVADIPIVPPPFAENLQSACPGDDYFARSAGPVYSGERRLA